MEIGQIGYNFSKELVLAPPPTIRLNRGTSEKANYIFGELSLYI